MADAPARLSTPLPEGALRFKRLSASEELGRLFEFSVLALGDDRGIDAKALLGHPAGIAVELEGGPLRHFHGRICAFGSDGSDEGKTAYRLVLRPWLWLLTRRSDTRIFQNKSFKDICDEVFRPFNPEVRWNLKGSYARYEYCVQYRESDFDFVSRLMEREGVYYYFEHTAAKHTLVIVDAPAAHASSPHGAQVQFREAFDAVVGFAGIDAWQPRTEVASGKAVLTDYNFETPKTSLLAQAAGIAPGGVATLEIYDWPGDHAIPADGERMARLRIEEAEARSLRVRGAGPARGLCAGFKFTLEDHPVSSQNAEHLVTATRIECEIAGYESGAGETKWRCEFLAMPSGQQWRPPRSTLRPTVPGPHTAVVVGKAGEEIWTDKYGRVKVQFHWDRHGRHDEHSSCWVRVSQPLAGKGFGFVALPRIGQEVVVDFIEGDPDRPLVTGRVYNADQTVPYALPDNQTVATFKTRSSKGGGQNDFNELRFEDKKDNEYVWFQAQKDYILHVKNDAETFVRRDRWEIVERNDSRHVKGACEVTVDKDHTVKIDGKAGAKVAKDVALESGASVSLKAGAAADVKIGANLGIDAAANVHLKAGGSLVIEAGATITLKAGASSVVIGGGTVSIVGPTVLINSGGSPGQGGGASPKPPDSPAPFGPTDDPLAS